MRWLYWLAGGAYAASRLLGSRRLQAVSKPAVVPLLIDAPLTAPTPEREIGLVGLAGGWAGDLLLMRPGGLRAGASAFAVNQAAYQWLLWRRGARFRMAPVVLRAVPFAAATWFGRGHLSLVAIYGGMVTATSALAADPAMRGRGLALGGNLFLLSDSLILLRLLLRSEGSRSIARGLDLAVALTYVLAQRMLVDGLVGGVEQRKH
ncbi:MAG: lysoplasmalogenase family protein [Corynebacterium sp.]|uniref:lysoplasmalogenase family protein n=1 Tax=Corynebacterium sp. TaxID=1720 RepID=UPI0026E10556|nr:lysoplasmalogenase family protein [Corynebacterium sp.]MDO5668508.1 lysoplasmalogenase family protein [Corynebacterium sp.]